MLCYVMFWFLLLQTSTDSISVYSIGMYVATVYMQYMTRKLLDNLCIYEIPPNLQIPGYLTEVTFLLVYRLVP